MIASCKAFVDTYLDDFASDATVVRSDGVGRKWGSTKQLDGWRLAVERDRSLASPEERVVVTSNRWGAGDRGSAGGEQIDLRDSVTASLQIILVPTGEIFSQTGRPRLTATEVMANPWAVPVWMTELKDRFEISRWPSEAEDLRRLAIEFHTTRRDLVAPVAQSPGSESAAAMDRQLSE